MIEISGRAWLAPIRRLWWVPAGAAVLTALLVAGLGTLTPTYSTTAVLNTRTVVTLPTDRFDLIEDVASVVAFDDILKEPAALAGMSIKQLRQAVAVQRIEGSTLAEVTFESNNDDPQLAEEVLLKLMANAADYLSQPNSNGTINALDEQITEATELEKTTRKAVDDAILANGGVVPSVEAANIQDELAKLRSSSDGSTARAASLRNRLPEALNQSRSYIARQEEYQQALEARRSLVASDNTAQAERAGLVSGLSLTVEERAVRTTHLTVQFRRALSGALAAGLLACLLLVLVESRLRRRSPAQ